MVSEHPFFSSCLTHMLSLSVSIPQLLLKMPKPPVLTVVRLAEPTSLRRGGSRSRPSLCPRNATGFSRAPWESPTTLGMSPRACWEQRRRTAMDSVSCLLLPAPPQTTWNPQGERQCGRFASSCPRSDVALTFIGLLCEGFLRIKLNVFLHVGLRWPDQSVSISSKRGSSWRERRRWWRRDLVQPYPWRWRTSVFPPFLQSIAGPTANRTWEEAQQRSRCGSGRQVPGGHRYTRGRRRSPRGQFRRRESGEYCTFHRGTTSAQTDARVQTPGGGGGFHQQSHR